MARPVVTEWIGRDVSASRTADKVAAKYTVAGKQFERTGGRLKGLTEVNDKLGLSFLDTGTIAAGASAAALAFYSSSIGAASDLQETQSKVGVVFGDSAGEVLKFGSNAASALGMSEQQAEEAAGTFGNLLTAMGFTQQAAAGMSTKMVQLASDLASFNNADPTETLEAIRAALVGEFDPIQNYGANLTAARVEQELVAKGAHKVAGAFTAQQKAAAALDIIMQDTAAAHGDFARTSDGLANSQRRLNAEIEDLKAQIGEGLLPAVQSLTQAAGPLISAFADLNRLTDGAVSKYAILGPVLGTVDGIIRTGTDAWHLLTGEQEKSTTAVKSNAGAQVRMKEAQAAAAESTKKLKEAHAEESKALGQVKDKIAGVIPAFDGYSSKSKLTASKILGNLHQEIAAYSNWATNVQTLLKRGASPAAVQALSEKGPQYVAAFVHASDKQLRDLNRSFRDRTRAAGRVATTEAKLQGGAAGRAAARAMEANFHPVLSPIIRLPKVAGGGIPGNFRQMAGGGVLTEPVMGVGLRTGTQYTLAEQGPEAVVPMGGGGSGASAGMAAASRVILEIRTGGSSLDQLLAQLIQKYVRVNGGNVQAALGVGGG